MFICRQKINLFFAYWNLSLRYWKDIANLLFWVLWACLAMQTQSDNIKLNSFGVYLQEKKATSSPMFYWRYYKDMQTHFGYFGQAWLCKPKMIA